ncbi:hypothetical protein B0H10DRAFT_2031473 [Mycena sp. CBHHK59/15]|nr:hypothetical protein B0H10DRAFT_2031473 [Mycena sp. CBHHK59/15]
MYFWSLLLCFLAVSRALQPIQVPFDASTADDDEWDLNTLPNVNATGHLVFDTVSSLLQHWPNARHHSGHTIVPGTVPTGTLLYHGRYNSQFPDSPEWAATDPEFARVFCSEPPENLECWILTLVVTRPLRVIYFDGSSATKMPDGPMDSQDLLAWGAVLPEKATVKCEYERLHRMCDLGRELGIDAYIRMQWNFEVMLCSFTDRVEVASFSRLEVEPMFHHGYSFIQAGTWHDRYPGETRIQLDLSHLISLYDLALAPSLISQRFGQERREHRVLGIDDHDIAAVMERLRIIPNTASESGVDWSASFKVIIERYAKRLEILQRTLDTTDDHDEPETLAKRAFRQLQTMLTPYLLRSAVPPHSAASTDNSWATPVFRVCTQTHTSFATSVESKLTASEHLLLDALETTNREICRTLVGMWSEGVNQGLGGSSAVPGSLAPLIRGWTSEVNRLMGWLDWGVWITCRPACAFDETCCLLGAPFWMHKWNTSHPQCLRLVEPYTKIWDDLGGLSGIIPSY